MSVEGFIAHGYHRGFVMARDGGHPFGEIKLYDIGEEGLIGAQYVLDGSRQAQPMAWHHGIERALRKHREENNTLRPSLRNKQKVDPPQRAVRDPMPTIATQRPTLRKASSMDYGSAEPPADVPRPHLRRKQRG